MSIRALSVAALILASSFGAANASTVLFADSLTSNDLNNTSIWSSNISGSIVAAPIIGPAGSNALTFTSLGSGGDLFTVPITGTGAGIFNISFDYYCATGSCGAFVGLAPGSSTLTVPSTLGTDAWLATDTDPHAYPAPFSFSSTGDWTHVSFDFQVTSAAPFGVKLEDFTGSPSDTFFQNLQIAAVPEASTWAMMILGFVGVGFLSYRSNTSRRAFRFT